MASLSDALAGLSQSLASIPLSLTSSIDVAGLSAELAALGSHLAPVSAALADSERRALLANATAVAQDAGALAHAAARLPPDLRLADPQAVASLIAFNAEPRSFLAVWQPSCMWMILILLVVAATRRAFFAFYLSGARLRRAADVALAQRQADAKGETDNKDNSGEMRRRASSMLAHAMNLVFSTVALGFQLAAYPILRLPHPDFAPRGIKLVYLVTQLISVAYVAELLTTDVHFHIVVHHALTIGLFWLMQLVVQFNDDLMWAAFAQWLMFLATIEQPTYLAMYLYHHAEYLVLVDRHSNARRRLYAVAASLLNFNAYYGYLQKSAPLALALYSLSRLAAFEWHFSALSRFAIVYAVASLAAMTILQMWFTEQNWAIAAHVASKAGASTDARSPFARLYLRLRRRRRQAAPPASPVVESPRSDKKVAAGETGASADSTDGGGDDDGSPTSCKGAAAIERDVPQRIAVPPPLQRRPGHALHLASRRSSTSLRLPSPPLPAYSPPHLSRHSLDWVRRLSARGSREVDGIEIEA